jgi:hypothetical protein
MAARPSYVRAADPGVVVREDLRGPRRHSTPPFAASIGIPYTYANGMRRNGGRPSSAEDPAAEERQQDARRAAALVEKRT